MAGHTIKLTSGQLELSNTGGAETIIAPPAGVTVNGGGLSRVFQVDKNVTAAFSELTITGGGGTADQGGGLLNLGNLTLTNSTVKGNRANMSGGGLANDATMVLTNCTISGNSAPNSNGGGLFVNGTTTLTNCTISGNMTGGAGGGLFR